MIFKSLSPKNASHSVAFVTEEFYDVRAWIGLYLVLLIFVCRNLATVGPTGQLTSVYTEFEQLCSENPQRFGTAFDSFMHESKMMVITFCLAMIFGLFSYQIETNLIRFVWLRKWFGIRIYNHKRYDYNSCCNRLNQFAQKMDSKCNRDIKSKCKKLKVKNALLSAAAIVLNHFVSYIFFVAECWLEMQLISSHEANDPVIGSETVKIYNDDSFSNYLYNFVAIFERVHPRHSWIIRLSHGIAYPFLIFAMFRKKMSQMCFIYAILVVVGLYYFGEFAHQYDSDQQLKCVRSAFITETKSESLHVNALRRLIAPYMNVLCLATDCSSLY